MIFYYKDINAGLLEFYSFDKEDSEKQFTK